MLLSCNKQSELQKLCKQIRKAPQTAFPAGVDEKWKLIKKFGKIEDTALPDSVKSIFRQIDTSIRGYSEYRLALLNLLAKPGSRKSLKILAEIFNENYINDPSCSQVLSYFFMMNERALADYAISYLTKEDRVDYSNLLKNADVMFPELAHVLGKQPFSDRPILDLLKFGIKGRVLNKENLASSLPDFTRYYDYLKFVRDTLARRQTPGYMYTGYYETHLPDLLDILKIFDSNEAINKIVKETGQIRETP
jgi:hypothetical protein